MYCSKICLWPRGCRIECGTAIADRIAKTADAVSFEWLNAALRKLDELSELVRRNIQKSIAFDAFAMDLRRLS